MSRIWRGLLAAAPVRLWAMILAAPALTALLVWLIWIVKDGTAWPLALAAARLMILGNLAYGMAVLIGVIVIALASVKVKGAGPAGLSLEVDADDPPQASATVTASVTTGNTQ